MDTPSFAIIILYTPPSVEEDLKIEETNLKNSGYEFRTLRYGSEEKLERAKVYVPELGGRRKTPSIQ